VFGVRSLAEITGMSAISTTPIDPAVDADPAGLAAWSRGVAPAVRVPAEHEKSCGAAV
jgi:hypothetical protein